MRKLLFKIRLFIIAWTCTSFMLPKNLDNHPYKDQIWDKPSELSPDLVFPLAFPLIMFPSVLLLLANFVLLGYLVIASFQMVLFKILILGLLISWILAEIGEFLCLLTREVSAYFSAHVKALDTPYTWYKHKVNSGLKMEKKQKLLAELASKSFLKQSVIFQAASWFKDLLIIAPYSLVKRSYNKVHGDWSSFRIEQLFPKDLFVLTDLKSQNGELSAVDSGKITEYSDEPAEQVVSNSKRG